MSDLPHDLQRHASGLRDLARDLLRDAHAAEDVTQDTLQRALTRPPREPGPIGGWLHRTMVNFARQWRRGERRRIAREATLPSPAPVPAVAEQLARREMLQRVTAAVLALEEPYQTTVFLRYFEDLPPRAIAQRTATNVATVKSRLARGLALLRARLERDHDRPWRAALAFCFGLPLAGTLWPIPTGTLLVSTTTKLLAVAGALCVGGLLAYQFRDDPAPLQAPRDGGSNAGVANAASTQLPDATPAADRTAAPAPATEAAWLEHPFEVGLDVLVVDSLGLPIEGHHLELAPFHCARNQADVATGADGKVALTWRTRQRALDVQVVDPRGQTRRVALQHGTRTQLVLLGRRQGGGGVRFVLGNRTVGTYSAEVRLDGGNLRLDASQLFSGLTTDSSADLRMHTGLHPAAVFGDPLATVAPEPDAHAGPDLQLAFAESTGTLELVGNELRVATRRGNLDQPAVTVAIGGVVFGVDGKPAAKLPIALLGSTPQPLQRGETDEQGRFRFENLQPGQFTVRAGGDHQGLATLPVEVTDGTTPCTLNLQRGACIQGRAVDDAGAPRAEHTVEWRALDGSWCDAARTGKDGTFVLANLPGGPGALFLFSPDGNRRIPIATAASVLPDSGEVVLAAPKDKGSVLRVEPPPREEGRGAPTIRAWHVDTGLAIELPAPEKGTVWSSPRLPSGFYDVELRVAGAGSRPLGRHFLDGEHDFDLGRVEAPRGGSIRIRIPAASLPSDETKRALEICSLRPDLDVRVEPAPLPLERTIHLPTGDYVLAFRHADGALRFHRFAVAADRETLVEPAP